MSLDYFLTYNLKLISISDQNFYIFTCPDLPMHVQINLTYVTFSRQIHNIEWDPTCVNKKTISSIQLHTNARHAKIVNKKTISWSQIHTIRNRPNNCDPRNVNKISCYPNKLQIFTKNLPQILGKKLTFPQDKTRWNRTRRYDALCCIQKIQRPASQNGKSEPS